MSEKLYGKILALKLLDIPKEKLNKGDKTPRLFIQVQPLKGLAVDSTRKPVTVDCLVQKAELAGQQISEGSRILCYVERGSKCYALTKVEKIYKESSSGYSRKKNNRGAEIGNAINVATHLTNSFEPEVVQRCASYILPEMQRIREAIANEYADMEDYARNMRLGQCFLLASQQSGLAGCFESEMSDHIKDKFEALVRTWFASACSLEAE